LLPGQEARLPDLCAPWRSAAAVDTPVDTALAEATLADLYDHLGLAMPRVVWADSPGAAARVLREAGVEAEEPVQAPDGYQDSWSVVEPVGVMPGDQWLVSALGWTLGEDVHESALRRVADELGLALSSWYAPPVEMCEGWEARSLLGESLRICLDAHREVPRGYGAWSAAQWIGFHDVLRQLGLLDVGDHVHHQLDMLAGLARSGCGWWWPRRRLCVVSRRPVVMATEEAPGRHRGTRLHGADGPALTFADGWTCHAWHGIPVPADLVEGGWPVSRILSGPTFELRRCAIERVGWKKLIEATGLEPLGLPVPDPAEPGGTLRLYDVPEGMADAGGARVLVFAGADGEAERAGCCRAWEVYSFFDDPVKAASWLLGLTRDQYVTVNQHSESPPSRTLPQPGRPLADETGTAARGVTVPLLSDPQRQGDIGVIPAEMAGCPAEGGGTLVPAEGVIIRAGWDGHPHRLLAEGAVTWRPLRADQRDVGVLTVEPGAAAFLTHGPLAPLGCAPGSYLVRRHVIPEDNGLFLKGVL
jgi:hypothetical protein